MCRKVKQHRLRCSLYRLLFNHQDKILTVKNYANTRFVNIILEKRFYTRVEKIAEKLSTTPDTLINNALLAALKKLEDVAKSRMKR